jgi:hypothetical protein
MKIKQAIRFLSLTVLSADLIYLTRAFILAYLNPSKTYTMNINNVGEATFEIILVFSLFPFGLYIIVNEILRIRRGE